MQLHPSTNLRNHSPARVAGTSVSPGNPAARLLREMPIARPLRATHPARRIGTPRADSDRLRPMEGVA